MPPYSVLTTRKRAIIALIHSVVFLLIALRSVVVASPSRGIFSAIQFHTAVSRGVALTAMFLIVTTILATLFIYSENNREKLYFGFCTISAATGLLRCLVGDPPFHSANSIRATMLVFAVVVGTTILRGYSDPELSSEEISFDA
jgi:hypothetical protein